MTRLSSSLRSVSVLSLLTASLLACDSTGAADDETAESAYARCDGGACEVADPLVRHEIGRSMGSGDFFEVPLDPKQKLKQITMIYDGQYRVPELDAQGKPKKNGEGRTYYKDGMYAHGFVVRADGSKDEVSEPKFIDATETDNWHDIPPLSGDKLRVDFAFDPKFANDPAVLAAKTRVRMERVIIQYEDPPGSTSQTFDYDLDDLLRSKAEIPASGTFAIDFDGSKAVYRVDVRWGDAKPRAANGNHVAGGAKGYLTVDDFTSDRRNVAMIETQAFAVKGVSKTADGKHRIAVHMDNDKGRVHWIKVFYK